MSGAFYVTSFCNFAHDLKTGKPIGHECYIIHPELLRQERESVDGKWDTSLREAWSKTRKIHPGLPRKADARKLSVKGKAMMKKLEAELDRKPYGDYRDNQPTGEVEEEETPLFADAPAGHSLESDEGVID